MTAVKDPVRILIADADADTRSLYENLLSPTGCEVVAAVDGRDALVKALASRPTLVITETRLPILDGYDLCAVLRRDAVTQSVPILVVTSETRIAMLERAHAAGVDAVLNKPVSPETLLTEIRYLLDHYDRSHTPPIEPLPTKKQAKAHLRKQTTDPPVPPPALTCPSCHERPLTYERSHLGGVNARHPEQWDEFICSTCGRFQYRHSTRKVRRVR